MGHKAISLFSAEYTVSTTGVSHVKESPMGWENVWFSCKYLEATQSTLEKRLDLETNFLAAARYFAHKQQNTIRPGQQVHADDLCIGVSFFFFECEGTESLTSAHIQDPKRASRTGAQLADARAKRELVLTEIGQLHMCELLTTPGKKRTGVLNH